MPARPPRDPLGGFLAAQEAYRAAFHDVPGIVGTPKERWPRLTDHLHAAIRRGRPMTEAEVREALGVAPLPPGALS